MLRVRQLTRDLVCSGSESSLEILYAQSQTAHKNIGKENCNPFHGTGLFLYPLNTSDNFLQVLVVKLYRKFEGVEEAVKIFFYMLLKQTTFSLVIMSYATKSRGKTRTSDFKSIQSHSNQAHVNLART